MSDKRMSEMTDDEIRELATAPGPPAADAGVCLHAGQVCVETESCGCPCSFCLAEADEARRNEG